MKKEINKKGKLRKNTEKKRKENFFLGNYKKCWNFLRESKKFIYFTIAVFCIFYLIGYLFPYFFKEEIARLIQALASKIVGKSAIEIISFIFLNNLKACAIALFTGIFLGIIPFGIALVNGYVAGFVSKLAVSKAESIFILWRLFPHGIFELPAVLISIGFGFRLGTILFRRSGLREELIETTRFFVFVIVPLLVIAALIEGILVFLMRSW